MRLFIILCDDIIIKVSRSIAPLIQLMMAQGQMFDYI